MEWRDAAAAAARLGGGGGVGSLKPEPESPAASPEHLLLVVPGGSAPAEGPAAETAVAGLPLLRRIVLAGSRAGLLPVLAGGNGAGPLLAGTSAVRLRDLGAMSGPRRFVLCPANVLPQAQWLRTLRDAPIERSVLYVDASRVALLETADPQAVLAAVARHGTAGEILDALGGLFRQAPWPADPRGRFVLGGAGDVGPAEAWLLRSLIKSSEGFMSRHVERRVSLMITRRLVRTGITPNAMTLVSVGVGLAAAPFFLSAQPVWQLLGALVFLAHSILDGCDGELARLKFLESPAGAILDFWGDNVVHVAIFTCMTVGWARASQAAWPLAVGAAAVASVAVATAVLSRRGLGPQSAAGSSTAARVVDALSNRDFIYLVLALATVGKAWWFLALVAGGTPIFVLLALRAGPREAA